METPFGSPSPLGYSYSFPAASTVSDAVASAVAHATWHAPIGKPVDGLTGKHTRNKCGSMQSRPKLIARPGRNRSSLGCPLSQSMTRHSLSPWTPKMMSHIAIPRTPQHQPVHAQSTIITINRKVTRTRQGDSQRRYLTGHSRLAISIHSKHRPMRHQPMVVPLP